MLRTVWKQRAFQGSGRYSDRSAIVGRLGPRLFEAHSFSGRGVMQSYGAGQALADLIARGGYEKLDASALARERFQTGRLVMEELHI